MDIYYKTNLEKIPNSCKECPCHWCRLPMKTNSHGYYKDEIKKAYVEKRHKNCPLKEV